MKKKTIIPKVWAAEAGYLDPVDCDSFIAYKVVRSLYLTACVTLSDCTRSIQWYFGDSKDSIYKIDKAITLLQGFKKSLVEAQKHKEVK
jgi:hypothetical protein